MTETRFRIEPQAVVEAYQKHGCSAFSGAWFDPAYNCFCPLSLMFTIKTGKTPPTTKLKASVSKILALSAPFIDGFTYGFDGHGSSEEHSFILAQQTKAFADDRDEFHKEYQLGLENGKAVIGAVKSAKIRIYDADDIESS